MLHLCLYEAPCYFTRKIGPLSTQLGLDGIISIYLSILAELIDVLSVPAEAHVNPCNTGTPRCRRAQQEWDIDTIVQRIAPTQPCSSNPRHSLGRSSKSSYALKFFFATQGSRRAIINATPNSAQGPLADNNCRQPYMSQATFDSSPDKASVLDDRPLPYGWSTVRSSSTPPLAAEAMRLNTVDLMPSPGIRLQVNLYVTQRRTSLR